MTDKNKFFGSISSRLLPAFLIVALIPVLMLTFSTFYAVKKVAVANTKHRTSEQFSLIEKFLEDMVVSSAMELSVIKGHDAFGDFLTGGTTEIVKADFEGAMVRHPEFLQLRYLDSSGMEQLRINRTPGGLEWVSSGNLQDKSDYYYFKQALSIAPSDIYVSDLDLNVEYNVVETPWRLVARIGIKVFHEMRFSGILLVNIDGNYILSKILPFAGNVPDRAFLMNSHGKYIGFDGSTFSVNEPEALNRKLGISKNTIVEAKPKTPLRTDSGYLSVMPVSFYRLEDGNIWRVMLYVSDNEILSPLYGAMKIFLTALAGILGLAAVFSLAVSAQIIKLVKDIVRYIPEAAGRVFRQTGIREFDEIGSEIHQMAVGLKNTTMELEELNSSLEERIKENVCQIETLARKQVDYEKQLRDIQSQLMHADRLASLGLISATVAHEIGNPLAAMKTSLQVLREDISEESDRDFVEKIIAQVDKLSAFLRSITRFGGRKQSEKKEVVISALLREVEGFLRAEMKKKNVSFSVKNVLDFSLYCDETQIRQVVFNIVINSIHELKDGGEITAETFVSDGVNCLHLYDSGSGVDDAEKLFSPFYTTKNDGTGLGLAIVKDLIKQNGWVMTAGNVENAGFGIKICFTDETK